MIEAELSFESARQISIVDYLNSLGFQPAKIRGYDYWYHSPFREERTPSFKVNTSKNVWFDHGTGEGGGIIDLGMKLYACSPYEFLKQLSKENPKRAIPPTHVPAFPVSKLAVEKVTQLSDKGLLHYLQSRSIPLDLANQHCKQILFRMNGHDYLAIGFLNQSGAWELRNKWFKGSSSPKDVSILRSGNDNGKICVLEGFMDFLSVIQLPDENVIKYTRHSNFLVLNSLRLLRRNISILRAHDSVTLLLDNDQPAKEAKAQLTFLGIRYHDGSQLYQPFKDVNEYLVARNQPNQQSHDQSIVHEPQVKQTVRRRKPAIRR